MRNRLILIIALLLSPLVFRHSPLMAQYEVLTLDSCLSRARQHNCTIRSAALEVAISQELKKQMLWKYFPQVSLQGFAFGAVNATNLDGGSSSLMWMNGEYLNNKAAVIGVREIPDAFLVMP